MNINKFFEGCKKEGIETAEINVSKSSKLAIEIFKGEITNYTLSNSSSTSARGIFNGKLGAGATERNDSSAINYLIREIKDGATYIERDEKPIIFPGSPKYKKFKTYNEELSQKPTEEKINFLLEIEKIAKSYDKRVTDIEVGYEEAEGESIKANSFGLKLKSKSNHFVVYCSVLVKDGAQAKTGFEVVVDNDVKKIDAKFIAEEACKKAISLLNGKNTKQGTYKAVLDQHCVGTFVDVILDNLNAESIQKGTSWFVDKLNQKVLSNKLTIEEKPLTKNFFFTGFDSEGVATFNKKVIDKGVLQTYFYNLATAAKDSVETTANGYGSGSKVGIGFVNAIVKPGKLTEAELFQKIGNGVYITGLQGLHAGLNPQNGDFSVQSQGFLIKDGKIERPLDLFTVTGNVFEMFNNIIAIGNNSKLLNSSTTAPSIAFKSLVVSGE